MIVKSRKLENFRLKIEMNFSLTCKWSPKIWALYCCLLLDFHWQKYGSCLCQSRVNLQHFLAPINSRLCRLVLNSQGGNNKITHNRARQSSQETRKTFFFCFFAYLILSHQDIKCIEFFRQDPYLNSQFPIQLDSISGRCFIIIFLCTLLLLLLISMLYGSRMATALQQSRLKLKSGGDKMQYSCFWGFCFLHCIFKLSCMTWRWEWVSITRVWLMQNFVLTRATKQRIRWTLRFWCWQFAEKKIYSCRADNKHLTMFSTVWWSPDANSITKLIL